MDGWFDKSCHNDHFSGIADCVVSIVLFTHFFYEVLLCCGDSNRYICILISCDYQDRVVVVFAGAC